MVDNASAALYAAFYFYDRVSLWQMTEHHQHQMYPRIKTLTVFVGLVMGYQFLKESLGNSYTTSANRFIFDMWVFFIVGRIEIRP